MPMGLQGSCRLCWVGLDPREYLSSRPSATFWYGVVRVAISVDGPRFRYVPIKLVTFLLLPWESIELLVTFSQVDMLLA